MPVRVAIAVLLSFIVFTPQSLAAGDIEQSLLADIKKAERHLNDTQRRIDNERRQMAGQLNTHEQSVLTLREKTAVARRLADENTLSLSQLEKRLDSWRQQHLYQQNLLNRFIRQHDIAARSNGGSDGDLQMQIAAVAELADTLNGRLYPEWRDNDVVLPSGEIEKMRTLAVGPVSWYLHADESEAGTLSVENGIFKTGLALTGGDRRGLERLAEEGEGIITFDPSLSRATVKAAQTESVAEHLVKGGLWVIPIILFALLALSIAILKGIQLWQLPKVTLLVPSQLQMQLTQAAPELPDSITGMQRRLLQIAVTEGKGQQRDDQLFNELQADKHWLERWIGVIAITASVSPLLGLLGTVSGMIETFKMMTLFGSGDPEVVSGGISQALITTELGLVVAIPALIINAVLSRRAKSYYSQLETFAIQLSQVEASGSATPAFGQPAISTKKIGASA